VFKYIISEHNAEAIYVQ